MKDLRLVSIIILCFSANILLAQSTTTKSSQVDSLEVYDATVENSFRNIKWGKLENRIASNLTKALDGITTGIQLTSGSGQPGADASILIRGFSSMTIPAVSPLFVIDGIPYDGTISAISLGDIESVTIIKDASAFVLYGGRGANGVVVITTKQGKRGKPSITFNGSWGVSSWAIPRYETLNAYEWTEDIYQMAKSRLIQNGIPSSQAGPLALNEITIGNSRIFGSNLQYYPFTRAANDLIDHSTGKIHSGTSLLWSEDWLDHATATRPLRQEYLVNVSGGTTKTNYLFSMGYLNEKGVIKTTFFERFSGRANVDSKFTNWLRTGLIANFAGNRSNATILGNEPIGNTSYSNLFYSTQVIAPIYPVYKKDPNGNTMYNQSGKAIFDLGDERGPGAMGGWNPVASLEADRFTLSSDNLSSRAFLEIGGLTEGVLKGIKLISNFGFDYAAERSKDFLNPYFGDGRLTSGKLSASDGNLFGYTFNQILNIDRSFKNHHLNFTAGYELYRYKKQYNYESRIDLPPNGPYEMERAKTVIAYKSYRHNRAIESVFAHLNYSYKNRYYLSASYRKDGISKFHNYIDGDFWSLGAGWQLSQEQFLQDIAWLDNLSIKGSYGSAEYDKILFLEEDDIIWGSNSHLNIGLEGALFDRVSFSAEYYIRGIKNLIPGPLPISGAPVENVGKMVNKGFELSLIVDIIKNSGLNWNMILMGSTIKNKVIGTVGEPLNSFYLAESAGIDPATGDKLYWVWDEINGVKGDKYISNNYQKAVQCRQFAGSTIPLLYGSWANNLLYRGFDFSILTTYSIGGKIFDEVYRRLLYGSNTMQAGHKDRLVKAWKNPGDITKIPRIDFNTSSTITATSDELIDASYFAIKNITLGYTLPSKWAESMKLRSLRFTFTAENLHIFTALKGVNPQYSFIGKSGGFSYRPVKTLSLGLNITI